MKIFDAGFPCVGLFGSSLSEKQGEMIVSHFKKVILLFDSGPAGWRCRDDCLLRRGRQIWVKAISLPQSRQPDMLSTEQLRFLLTDEGK